MTLFVAECCRMHCSCGDILTGWGKPVKKQLFSGKVMPVCCMLHCGRSLAGGGAQFNGVYVAHEAAGMTLNPYQALIKHSRRHGKCCGIISCQGRALIRPTGNRLISVS